MANIILTPKSYDLSSSFDSINVSYPLTNGLGSNADSETYSEINLTTGTNAVSKLIVLFDVSKVPSGAVIDSISCRVKARISNSSPYILTGAVQLYCGDTAMGGDIGLDTSATTQTFNDVGYWDYDRLQTLKLIITCTRGVMGTTNTQTLRFYGADITVNYSGSTEPAEQLKIKNNGSWINVAKVYKRVNGSWIEQSDIINLFDKLTNYVKG